MEDAVLQVRPSQVDLHRPAWVVQRRYLNAAAMFPVAVALTREPLANPQIERLKRKYISRPDKPATRFELAVQTVEGRPGIPSEFVLTGLRQLLDGLEPTLALSA